MYFYKCLNCKDVATKLGKREAVLKCCDERMKKLEPGIVDASLEKHVPIIEKRADKITVRIGKELHPMTHEHYIEWVTIETTKGFHTYYFSPGDEPVCTFLIEEDIIHVYAYCNLHELWKA